MSLRAAELPRNHPGAQVHRSGTQAGAMMGNLEIALKNLEREILADKSGLLEMKTHLDHLHKEKERLESEVSDMQSYCDNLVGEGAVGQALKQFDSMEEFLRGAYAKVLVSHAQGIEMLKKEFGYHPAYKRGREGEFTASYFTPCRNPNNPNKR